MEIFYFLIISNESYYMLQIGYNFTLKIYLYLKNNISTLENIYLSTILCKGFLLQSPKGLVEKSLLHS